jgi:hypothetical protein
MVSGNPASFIEHRPVGDYVSADTRTGLAKSVFPVTPSDRYSRNGARTDRTTETSAAQSIMGGEFHLLSEVALGGVEPPTYRFSGLQ